MEPPNAGLPSGILSTIGIFGKFGLALKAALFLLGINRNDWAFWGRGERRLLICYNRVELATLFRLGGHDAYQAKEWGAQFWAGRRVHRSAIWLLSVPGDGSGCPACFIEHALWFWQLWRFVPARAADDERFYSRF